MSHLSHDVIDATIEELRHVALAAEDACGYFAALYVRVTQDIAGRVRDRGFEDGARMEALADTFAGYYLRARRGEGPVPRCWQASWDVAPDPDLLIVQHLLLGANAHVNHDLTQAVVDVAERHGGLAAVRDDFDTVNDVLAASFTSVIRDLDRVSRWASEAAALGGGLLFNFSLRRARSTAWQGAQRLEALDADERREYVHQLDGWVSTLAYLITHPSPPVALLARLGRRLEMQDAVLVTRVLLGDITAQEAFRAAGGRLRTA
ncbi:MAG TPA: DUF5995 family protein [Acidimicrobiales bacterium]|nr:DUF5995 family protein [Acidimicrobiales bacterium]